MSGRNYSRRYGRSEHPIVIDMVDYGNEDFDDEYTYSSSHYSSPRHPSSVHSTPRHLMVSPSHNASSPRHSSSRYSSPRHTTPASVASNRHSSPRHSTSRHSRESSNQSPRQAVHMHNFAQRRSFMMGGFERSESQDQQSADQARVYRMENEESSMQVIDDTNEDNQEGGGVHGSDGIIEKEYRQSPGRSRSFRLLDDDTDTRERPVPVPPDTIENYRESLPRDYQKYQEYDDEEEEGVPIYSSIGNSNMKTFDADRKHNTPTHQVHTVDYKQGATFPVDDRTKRHERSVFTFDNSTIDTDLHTVPGTMNRSNSEKVQHVNTRGAVSVAPETEKKVFYFDIDDLSQRLLSSGDQDLSRRLRKKKAKNARSRISRNRARRKSKKSVFNLELDSSATTSLLQNTDGVPSRHSQEEPMDIRNAEASEASNRKNDRIRNVGGPSSYLEAGVAGDRFASNRDTLNPQRSVSGSTREENNGGHIRRNPSVGSPPAENVRSVLSTDNTMEFDIDSVPDRCNPSSPRGVPTPAANLRRHEAGHPADGSKMNSPSRSGTISPTELAVRGSISPTSTYRDKAEMRVTKVYDDISDRLDHIVRREDDVENRQKAIRAVFEEVQQHVADLRKNKQSGTKGGIVDKQETVVDSVSITAGDKPKRAVTDEGDDQVIKRRNESSDVEEVSIKQREAYQRVEHNGAVAILPAITSKPAGPTSQNFAARRPAGDIGVPNVVITQSGQPPGSVGPVSPVRIMPPPVLVSNRPVIKRSAGHFGPAPLIKTMPDGGWNSKDDVVPTSSAINVNNVPKDKKSPVPPAFSERDGRQLSDEKKVDSATIQRDGVVDNHTKQEVSKPSSYLSSDNGGDDDVVVQTKSAGGADREDTNDVVYVIEEEDGKSVVHVENQAETFQNETNMHGNEGKASKSQESNDVFKLEDASDDMLSKALSSPTNSKKEASDAEGEEAQRKKSNQRMHSSKDDLDPMVVDDQDSLSLLERHIVVSDKPDAPNGAQTEPDGLEPDGNKLEPNATKQKENSHDDKVEQADRNEAVLESKELEEARKRAIRGDRLNHGMLESDNDDEEVKVDIDKEFARVVPLDGSDSDDVHYNIDIDETLNRVARESELKMQERAKSTQAPEANLSLSPTHGGSKGAMSKQDEEEKANAILNSLSNGSLFLERPQSPGSMSYASRTSFASRVSHTSRATSNRMVQSGGPSISNIDSGSNIGSFVELAVDPDDGDHGEANILEGLGVKETERVEEEDEDDGIAAVAVEQQKIPRTNSITDEDNDAVSVDYDFNLAISAATKSSSSASDLQEFPLAQNVSGDNYGSASTSNVSSDISESTSASVSESSYDSFISIVETEDESDLEFFDEQEGFAENFMSNLVSSTFGWIEKKQEQLVCGFKSGEFDGPSLLRESMNKSKKAEKDASKDNRNQTMKSLRNAVASKYGRDNPSLPISGPADPVDNGQSRGEKKNDKKREKKTSKSSRHVESTRLEDDRKRGKRIDTTTKKRSGHVSKQGKATREAEHQTLRDSKMVEKAERKESEMSTKARLKDVSESRLKSLVDERKGSDSDLSEQRQEVSGKRKSTTKRKTSSHHHHQQQQQQQKKNGSKSSRALRAAGIMSNKEDGKFSAKNSGQRRSRSKVAESGNYNFDILSSDDDEAGRNEVQIIAVKPGSVLRAEDEFEEGSKSARMVETTHLGQREIRVINVEDADEISLSELNLMGKDEGPATATKSKPRRSNKHHTTAAVNKKPNAGKQISTSKTAKTRRARSPDDQQKPGRSSSSEVKVMTGNYTSATFEDRDPVGAVAAEQISKGSSSKSQASNQQPSPSAKPTRKGSRKERVAKEPSSRIPPTTDAATRAKEKSKSSRRKTIENSRGRNTDETRNDESESEADSTNHMTEEEREKARKERRRAAALKRRRKLRERRRAKLEQNPTDDTFG